MALLDLLLPERCPACGRPGPSPCPPCAATLVPAPALPPPPGLDTLQAVVRYDGVVRSLVHAAKYRHARAALERLGLAAATLVDGLDPPPALVTWAPTTPRRARRRGFDQAALVARVVARSERLPLDRALRRPEGPHQTGRSARERWDGPRFDGCGPVPPAVLVVDDVCTTGATLAAAAEALRRAGATTVHGLVVAWTPPPGTRR